jgi:DNA-binding response OmpR family regulator
MVPVIKDLDYILVVDHKAEIRACLAEALQLDGFAVRVAASEAEALELVSDSPPALVILDLSAPGGDSTRFADELELRGIQLPIAATSLTSRARDRADDIGACAFLEKPFGLTELRAAVEACCAASEVKSG